MGTVVRGVLAVLGGLVTVLAIDGLCYYVSMHVFGVSFDHPTTGFLIANLGYSYISRIIGGFVAGDIAHRKTLRYGVALTVILLLVGVYNLSKGFGVFGRATTFVVLLNVVGPFFAIYGAYLWSRGRPVRR